MRTLWVRVGLLLPITSAMVACSDTERSTVVRAAAHVPRVREWPRAKRPADEARDLLALEPRVEGSGTVRLLVHIEGVGDDATVLTTEPAADRASAKRRVTEIQQVQLRFLSVIDLAPNARTTFLTTVPFLAIDVDVRALRAVARQVAEGLPFPDGTRKRVHAEPVSTLRIATSSPPLAEVPLDQLLQRLEVGAAAPRGQGRIICIVDTRADERMATLNGRVEASLRIGAGYPNHVETLPALSGPPPAAPDHGTLCACMAAAAAPGARILSLAVDDGAGGYRFDDVLAALDWVVRARLDHRAEGLDVVSLSLSDPAQPSTETCGIDATQASCFARHVENLGGLGVVVAVAAGNSQLSQAVTFPACVANCMTVGATDGQFARQAQYSNWGEQVDLAVPGSDVLLPGWYYSLPSGTSVATPFAAGIIARLREAYPGAKPDLLVEALLTTGVATGPSAILAPTPEESVPEIRFDTASKWIAEHVEPGDA